MHYVLKNAAFVTLVLALVGGSIWTLNLNQNQEEARVGSIRVVIEDTHIFPEVLIGERTRVLDALTELNAKDPALQLRTESYVGLGVLVTEMYGLVNGADQKYWTYEVNNVTPPVGADAYILNSGDEVEWFFTTSTYDE